MQDIFDKYHSRANESSAKWVIAKANFPNLSDDVIPMTVADMDYELADEIKEGLKEYIDNTILGYTIPPIEYKEALINHYKKTYSVDIKAEEIMPATGVVPALFDAIAGLTKQDDGVIVFTPVYPQFFSAIEKNNGKVVRCPLIYKDKDYSIDFELFEQLAKEKQNTTLIICSPHNPSGRIWTRDELDRLADIAIENDLLIISDEIHADIVLYGNEMTSFYQLGDKVYDNSIVMSSASKSYNVAGLQCAHVLIKNEELRDKFFQAMELHGVHGPNMLGMKATELAYTKAGEWFELALKAIEENLDLTKKFFESYGELFEYFNTKATYLAWVNFEKFARKFDLQAEDFYKFIGDNGFIAHRGDNFGEEGKYFLRINVAMPKHKYQEILDSFKESINREFNI